MNVNSEHKVVYQSQNFDSHIKVAYELLKKGHAYKCYLNSDELEKLRIKSRKNGIPIKSPWRNKKELDDNKNREFVIRLKMPSDGTTTIDDIVQGKVTVKNEILDDMVILRSDNTPTYMLSSVVDDNDMGITHIIRGDDHKINTFKQKQIYEAMKWNIPVFAHIPLIHSEKGSKLSKRDKSSTIDDYVKIGILPDALRNYLLRLGWAYKDKEIFSLDESIKLFDLKGVGKSPSKLDMSRILSLNEHYIKNIDEKILFDFLKSYAQKYKKTIDPSKQEVVIKSLNFLKIRLKPLMIFIKILNTYLAKE